MTNRLELNWKLDGFVDEQRYYCSETPIDVNNLPSPSAILSSDARTYIDNAPRVLGKKYHVRIGAVKNGTEKISQENVIVYGQPWLPLQLSTALYFDGNSIVQTSNVVSQMNDLSVNAFHATQSNNMYRPILSAFKNGAPAVKFNGINQFLDVLDAGYLLNGASAWWHFAVFEVSKKSSDNDILAFGGKAKIVQVLNSDKIMVGGRRLTSDSWVGINSVSNVSNSETICFGQADYATRSLFNYVNGNLESSSTTWQTSGVTDNTMQTVRVGANPAKDLPGGLPGVFSNAKIGCCIMGRGVLSAEDRQKLEGWAAHKYGLTDNLPIDHPYKTLVPTI